MKRLKLLLTTLIVGLFVCGFSLSAYAYTDEILDYSITADVNDDATVDLYYHISWKVLDSDSLGPLDWIQVGIPNSHNTNLTAQSDTIDDISYMSSANNKVRIDLDRKYYEGEVVDIDFSLTQDYLYLVNVINETATYSFTPGWFDDIKVDKLTIRWSGAEIATEWTPSCFIDEDYLEFETSLGAGEKFTITVTYPQDAYEFNSTVVTPSTIPYDDGMSPSDYYQNYNSSSSYSDDSSDAIVGFVAVLIFIFVIVKIVISASSKAGYTSGSGFTTTKVITRKMITYYPNCPGCGAVRQEDQTECAYCGRSFVEKEEVITEKKLCDDARYAKDGLYKYDNNPNVYIHVSSHTVRTPKPASSSHHSSCAHSSCACACASCACACACACAGGGRAGCSTKDFYNTNLKLKQLEKRK